MERHFGLPIALAAALHGALLFGVQKSPRPAAPKALPERAAPVPFVLRDEEPVPVEQAEAGVERKAALDTPAPVISPEPVSVNVLTDITIPVPPVPRVQMTDGTRLPLNLPTPGGTREGSPFGGVVDGLLLDNTPRTRFQTAPNYPYPAKREGLSGNVVVDFVVDESGSVLEPRIVSSSNPVFEEASLRAVAKWKFEPGKRNGRIVRFRMTVPLVFTLHE